MLTCLSEWIEKHGGCDCPKEYLRDYVSYHIENDGVIIFAPFGAIEGVGFVRTGSEPEDFDWQEGQGGEVAMIDALIATSPQAKQGLYREFLARYPEIKTLWGYRKNKWKQFSKKLCYKWAFS